MKHELRNILYLLLVILIMSFAFQYLILKSNSGQGNSITGFSFFSNTLACILQGLIDFIIVKKVININKSANYLKNIFLSILFTSVIVLSLSIGINTLLSYLFFIKIDLFIITVPVWLFNCLIVFFISSFLYADKQLQNEKKIARIEKEKLQYQYELLKSQLNPHFLFNSFNALSSLVYEDADKANLFTKKLSELYRYILNSSQYETISLVEELNFVQSYFYLEQIRFGPSISLEMEPFSENVTKKIIPTTIQLLVENAIKHNQNSVKKPLTIHIFFDNYGLCVSNNLQPKSATLKNGFGLSNIEKQYKLLGKEIRIEQTSSHFIVFLPFID